MAAKLPPCDDAALSAEGYGLLFLSSAGCGFYFFFISILLVKRQAGGDALISSFLRTEGNLGKKKAALTLSRFFIYSNLKPI